MTDMEQRTAAKQFAEYWKGKGDEKGESQKFWLSLLQNVYGVEHPEDYISFEDRVFLGHTSFIDGYIDSTKVLIEQKAIGKDLKKAIKQSDGSMLTPFQQAKRYITELPVSKHPRWVVTCNFEKFLVYDMDQPGGDPEEILLENLPEEYYRLQFLTNNTNLHLQREMEVSIAAGEIVGILYDALLKEYVDSESEQTLKSLNVLCVRLVFCLYAEDAGIFGRRGMFHDYLAEYDTRHMRKALIELFEVLDTKPEDRDPYLESELAAFPYVNGGLFADEKIEIPLFTDEICELILTKASSDFDWSQISPTIFGAVFESTLNPETRRSGGMHYTSIENIHKVIDPLFLDDLKKELAEICEINVERTRQKKLRDFQSKLAGLTFLDPACGSGNFLTETYISLRKLENQVLKEIQQGQIVLEFANPIKVSIGQFYGIEINDFAVTVAKTALWIAESQMMKQTEDIVHMDLDFLPLKTYANIVEGNALRLDWESVIPKHELNYIMGNPPFVGYDFMVPSQKEDMQSFFGAKTGRLDYVTAWYMKAGLYILKTDIKCAFVSTNSITQGVQVPDLWLPMMYKYNVHIDFAYKTFIWDSEANLKAHVHCVIVGFSSSNKIHKKILFDEGKGGKFVNNISPYLIDSENIIVEKRSKALCNVPNLILGNMPKDGGGFVLTEEEKNEFKQNEPLSEQWIKPYIGAVEFINNKKRYCLWLVNASPAELKKCPMVTERIRKVREFRLASKAESTRKFGETPTLFCQIAQPDSDFIIVPKTSSGRRRYIPLGFASKDIIVSDLVFIIPNASLYEFGVLSSNIHNAWMRVVGGRLKSDYRYSRDIVYNTFPWPEITEKQKQVICQTAQAILNARILYPDCSLADLYDPLTMPPELLKAHQENDKAVMQAYGFVKGHPAYGSESACVAELMKMYQKMTEEK